MPLDMDLHPTAESTLKAYGSSLSGFRTAHADTRSPGDSYTGLDRLARERDLAQHLGPLATLPVGAGDREHPEDPDPELLCFEVDIERIRYSASFRRLAGKCQVFVTPRNDMVRTRLTHTLEVAGVARRVAEAARLCVPLAEAMALGHDCGHGPGGHAAEEAFDEFLPGGFDHAAWGADVVLRPLNLCRETLDGIRQHSWKLSAPSTAEGEVVSWADRIAYVVADWSDAVRAGIVTDADLPASVRAAAGSTETAQLSYFCSALAQGTTETGQVGMFEDAASVLDEFRQVNFERIYLRPASMRQAQQVVEVLRALVEFYSDMPGQIPDVAAGAVEFPSSGSSEAVFEAVRYVASMTDRYAFDAAHRHLGWDPHAFPRSV